MSNGNPKSNLLSPFTQAKVAGVAPPASGRIFLRDPDLPAFGVRVTHTGAKSFIIFKRIPGGKPVTITLGRFPDLNVKDARRLAAARLGEMAGGANPNAVKREARREAAREQSESVTLADAWDAYRKARAGKLRPRTLQQYAGIMRGYFADWQGKPLRSLTRDMIEARHRHLTESSGGTSADGAFRVLRACLNYAEDKFVDGQGQPLLANPVARLRAARQWNRPQRRQTFIRDEQLPAWWAAVQGIRPLHEDAADLLELLALTALRPIDAKKLQWSGVDFTARTLTCRDTKNHQDHTLPMTHHVEALLRRRAERAADGEGLVFPGRRAGHPITEIRGALMAMGAAYPAPWIVYDLRRTHATAAEGLDLPFLVQKRLLGHSVGDVTAGYSVLTIERLRGPAQAVEDKLLRAAGVLAGGDVVTMPERGKGAQ